MPNETARKDAISPLVHNLVTTQYGDIPARAREVAKMDILDVLGVCLAASGTDPASGKVAELAKEMGGKEESSIVSFGGKVPAPMAAFANAAQAWALNYADLNDGLFIHLGYVTVPAALAIAERRGKVGGKEFIATCALAMDLECRLARALVATPAFREWDAYGWLIGQVFGYFGSVAAASRMLRLSEERAWDAFGLTYSQVGGNVQPLIGGSADKGVYPAYPAKAGVLAALMAEKGINGPGEILEGRAGLYKVFFGGHWDPSTLTKDLGKSFEGTGFYQYPACGHIQPYVDLTLRMVKENKIRAQDIESMTVSVGPGTATVCEPADIRRAPRNVAEGVYSLPFILAAGITKGRPRVSHLTVQGLKDPEILGMAARVGYRMDEECDEVPGTGAHPVRIEMKLKGGRTIKGEDLELRYGHPERPFGWSELEDKFKDCAAHAVRPMSAKTMAEVISTVKNLEQVDDISRLVALVA